MGAPVSSPRPSRVDMAYSVEPLRFLNASFSPRVTRPAVRRSGARTSSTCTDSPESRRRARASGASWGTAGWVTRIVSPDEGQSATAPALAGAVGIEDLGKLLLQGHHHP